MIWFVRKKVLNRVGEKQSIREKSVKLHLPDMKVKKKFKKEWPESLRKKSFMSPKVDSCRNMWFHVERCNFMSEVVKALNPTWKCIMVTWNCKTPTWKWLHDQKNFMSRKCKFHVPEKVHFPDEQRWIVSVLLQGASGRQPCGSHRQEGVSTAQSLSVYHFA